MAENEHDQTESRTREGGGVREARIDHIVGLMSQLQFRRGETSQALAKEWGLSVGYVQELAAEASKRVAAAVMDSDHVREMVGAALERLLRDATDDDVTGKLGSMAAMQNRKVIVEAATAWSKIAGADAPKRSELTGKDGGPLQVKAPIIFVPEDVED